MRVSRKETRVSEEKEHSSLESERDEEHSHEKFIWAVENKVRERLWVSKSPAKERSSMSVRNVPRSLGDSVCSDASNVRNAPDNNNYSNYYYCYCYYYYHHYYYHYYYYYYYYYYCYYDMLIS